MEWPEWPLNDKSWIWPPTDDNQKKHNIWEWRQSWYSTVTSVLQHERLVKITWEIRCTQAILGAIQFFRNRDSCTEINEHIHIAQCLKESYDCPNMLRTHLDMSCWSLKWVSWPMSKTYSKTARLYSDVNRPEKQATVHDKINVYFTSWNSLRWHLMFIL